MNKTIVTIYGMGVGRHFLPCVYLHYIIIMYGLFVTVYENLEYRQFYKLYE